MCARVCICVHVFSLLYFNSLRQLETEKERNDKSMSEDISRDQPEKGVENEEKQELPESALFQPIQDDPRKKVEPSKEMQAAMKVLNDSFKKSPSRNVTPQIKNATNIIQQEWFKISSTANANPLDVEDYLDCFEEYSSTLLEYIVNTIDSSGNTAMHYAVSHGNFDVVSILLDSKVCDINKANVAGYTALMLAALAEVKNSTHASVANRLFQLADVNIRAKLVMIYFYRFNANDPTYGMVHLYFDPYYFLARTNSINAGSVSRKEGHDAIIVRRRSRG